MTLSRPLTGRQIFVVEDDFSLPLTWSGCSRTLAQK
jgi:hypothetical protein